MSANEVKKPKASERLSSLEMVVTNIDSNLAATSRRVGELELLLFNLSRENEILKDALQLLNEKQLSIISLNNEGKPLTDDNINSKVVDLKEAALKERLNVELRAGNIKESNVISENSVLVGRELNQEGVVENPRIQFLVGRLIPELKNKFIDKKVGDLIKGNDGKFDIEIMEIYDFTEKELDVQEPVLEEKQEASE